MGWAMSCCSVSWGEPAADETAKPSADSSKASGETPMDEINTQSVKITRAESEHHKLPAAEISLDLGESGLSGRKFPEKGDYLSLSGPPGGPLGLRISHLASVPSTDEEWQTLIKKLFAERTVEMGTAGEIKFGGENRASLTCTTDSGPARAHHLLIVIAVPDAKDAILVDFYRRAGQTATPGPAELAKDGKFAELSPSFSIRFE
jgi:hypothetical protein